MGSIKKILKKQYLESRYKEIEITPSKSDEIKRMLSGKKKENFTYKIDKIKNGIIKLRNENTGQYRFIRKEDFDINFDVL